MNITTRTTIVSNVQLDDNIRIWLLEEEGFKSAPENCSNVPQNVSLQPAELDCDKCLHVPGPSQIYMTNYDGTTIAASFRRFLARINSS